MSHIYRRGGTVVRLHEWEIIALSKVLADADLQPWDDEGRRQIRSLRERLAAIAYSTRAMKAERARYARAVRVRIRPA